MKQFSPMIRALCERVRRPANKQILAGLLLTAPAGIITLSGIQPDATSIRKPVSLAPIHAVAPPDESALKTAAAFAQEYKISASLAREIHEAAREADISPQVAFGLVRAESSFRTSAVSPVGAIGLTQLMPATARWLEPGISRSELRNPDTNLRVGFKYLRMLIDKYDGNEKLALTAFNRGPGTVDKLLKRGRNPDNGYAEKVITGKSKKHVALMNKKFGKKRV